MLAARGRLFPFVLELQAILLVREDDAFCFRRRHMSKQAQRLAIHGSGRKAAPNARKIRPCDPDAKIRVSIFARRNPHVSSKALAKANAIRTQPILQRSYLTGAEFNEVYGADPDDLAAIEKFAADAGLKVIDTSVPKRRVLVEGRIADVESAFDTELNEFEHPEMGRYRGREGKISVPEALFPIVAGVEGLDTRPVGRPRLVRTHFAPHALTRAGKVANRWPGTFLPPQLAGLYDFPSEADGTGQNLAIFAFNGGNSPDPRGGYSATALKTYYVNVLKGKMPTITDVVVQGPGNDPGPDTKQSNNRGDSTGEIMLDLCVAGALVPGAKIFVYFTEFSAQGWIEALHQAITDKNSISVISISYGNSEDDPNSLWTLAGIKLVNQAFEAAASKGITICCASGDDGSRDDARSGAHADFPASSPWVLGVGGTSLKATQGANPQIASEVVWNDYSLPTPNGAGGGGVSSIFPLPSYQNASGVPASANPPHKIGRGVPDVAAVADPYTGVVVMHIDGKHLEPIGGTSASAPLWASLLVRINQALRAKVGFLNPTLYDSLAEGVLNDITVGNNGAYQARLGWDACTGFGSPSGNKLLHALRNAPAPPAV
jgi:kumamolisin